MRPADLLVGLGTQFAVFSLLAFGGASGAAPEIQRQAVAVHHWMSQREFVTLFAIAQAAPGPNFLISSLVGWKVAGLAGATVATLAMCLPSCLLAAAVARVWERHRAAAWRVAIAAALAPISVGLIAATGWILARGADADWRLAMVTGMTTLACLANRLNPLWCLGVAAVLGWAGVFA